MAILLGLLWAARSLQSFADPDFADPSTAADWFAVLSLSIALVLLPAGLFFLVELQPSRRVTHALVLVAAVAALVAGVSNVVETGGGVDEAGTAYFLSIQLTIVSLVLLSGALLMGRPRWPALVVAATITGMLLLERGGGVLVLLAWLGTATAMRFSPGPSATALPRRGRSRPRS